MLTSGTDGARASIATPEVVSPPLGDLPFDDGIPDDKSID
jgi:hypothetical protein